MLAVAALKKQNDGKVRTASSDFKLAEHSAVLVRRG
jgi:hypothetical protein